MVDVSIRIGLLNMLMNMRDEFNVTIILITHDLALAKYFAWEGRLAVMYLGRVVEVGHTQDIIADPKHPYTKILLSAIPEADPERTRSKQHIQLRSEDIPRLTELPPGCAFHPRCPWFVPGVCEMKVPELKPVPGAVDETDVACIPLTSGETLELYGV
jgi:peptide/nickel transport system ATP-binding protein